MKHLFLTLSFAVVSLTMTAQPSWAQHSCHQAHSKLYYSRLETTALIRFQHLAAVKTPQGLPVILMNNESLPKLKPLTSKSIGFQVALQPDWKNDHGLLRLGNIMIDMDTPGARGYGEILDTGLAWKNIYSYLPRMNEHSNKIVEVTFALSDSEFKTAAIYQKLRRAAIYRVPFTFGGAQNNLNQLNMLRSGGENCFSFCRGASLPSQISEMRTEIQKNTGVSFENLKQIKDVRNFLQSGLDLIYHGDAYEPDQFNNEIALKAPEAHSVQVILKALNAEANALETMNWLLALESSLQYQNLLKQLHVDYGVGWEGAQSPRATAILIYDPTATTEEFQSPDYVRPGIFNSWRHQGTVPVIEKKAQ